jgi:hypothetical protein
MVAIAGTTLAAGSVFFLQTSSSADSICEPYVGTIDEDTEYIPVELQRGLRTDPVLNPTGSELSDEAKSMYVSSVDGVPLQLAAEGGDGSVALYYLDEPISSEMTRSEFQAAGGIELEISPGASPGGGWETFAQYLHDEFGNLLVSVDDTTAALVWADPEIDNEVRMHHVYWDQDDQTYGLIINRGPEDAVSVARSVACSID